MSQYPAGQLEGAPDEDNFYISQIKQSKCIIGKADGKILWKESLVIYVHKIFSRFILPAVNTFTVGSYLVKLGKQSI